MGLKKIYTDLAHFHNSKEILDFGTSKLVNDISVLHQNHTLSSKYELWEANILLATNVIFNQFLIEFLQVTSIDNKQFNVNKWIIEKECYEFYFSQSENSIILNIKNVNIKNSNQLRTKSYKTMSLGRIKFVKLKIEENLGYLSTYFSEIIVSVINSYYSWLNIEVNSHLSEVFDKLSNTTFRNLRKLFPNKIANELWVYVNFKGFGIYFNESKSRKIALENVCNFSKSNDISPLAFHIQFFTEKIKFDDSLLRLSLNSKNGHILNVLDSPLISGFHIVEKVICNTNELCFFNFLINDDCILSIGCRPEIREYIEPVISSDKNDLPRFFKKKFKQIDRVFSSLDSHDDCYNSISDRNSKLSNKKDILMVRPNFYGIGIDFNALSTKISDYWRKKK